MSAEYQDETHRHVTLDEDVFHGYQDVAEYARRISDGETAGENLRFFLDRLDTALAASAAACDTNPDHGALKDITCLYCGSDLIYWIDLLPEGPGPDSTVSCDDCGALWDAQFKAVRAGRR